MQNKISLTFILLLSFINIYAQNIDYSGKIKGSSNNEYIVTLQSIADSAIVYSVNTSSQLFEFKEIKKAKYLRCIISDNVNNCVTVLLNTDTYDHVDIDIDIEKTKEIQEVVIKNKKPFLTNKNGVLNINIENSPILSSGSIFETLIKLPSIQYNYSSNSFRSKGKEGIQVLIDGQRLYLQANELSDYLKNIPSSDIESIEITSNPSSKYDASGNAGIINIKTKKIKREGFYTGISLASTQAKYYKQNTSIKSQYNTKNSRYMLQYINSLDNDFEDSKTYNMFDKESSNQNTYAKIKGITNTITSQYERNFKNSNLFLNSTLSFYNEKINQNTSLNFTEKESNNNFLNVESSQISTNKLRNFDFGLNYKINFNKSDLSFKSNYINYAIDNFSILKSISTPQQNVYYDLKNSSPNNVNAFISQLDYANKIDSLSNFEAGSKLIIQKIDNKNNFFQNIENFWQNDIDKTNDYLYKELILSGYLQYYKTISKFDFTLGSRLEYSPSNGYNSKNNYDIQRKQTNFFPYLNIAYNISDNHNLNFSYTKRINRASFNNLMPFEYYVDPFTKIVGNPSLIPNISNNIEVQYIFKQNYLFSISYSLSKNAIYQTATQDNTNNSIILSPYNIDKSQTITFNSNLTFKLYDWWDLNFNGILFYDKIHSNTPKISQKNISAQLVTSNTFSLSKKIKFEVSTDYVSPSVQGPYKTSDLFLLNTGISKSFLENKLKISLIGNDILKTYKIKNRSIIDNQISSINQNIGTHWIRLNLIYKFTKGLEKKSKEKDEYIEEIESRIK